MVDILRNKKKSSQCSLNKGIDKNNIGNKVACEQGQGLLILSAMGEF